MKIAQFKKNNEVNNDQIKLLGLIMFATNFIQKRQLMQSR